MLHINDLTVRIEGRLLFDKATVALPDRAKTGLVGRNGTGKSTLLRVIRGELAPEAGSTSIRRGARVGAVEQEAPGGALSLLDVVLAHDEERAALLAEAETAADPHRIAEIQSRLVDIAAHSAEARAAEILSGLGFAAAQFARPCGELSGGWRMRVALAGVLFARPDLLLLDEPTNYLDLEGAIWLEGWLKDFRGAALIVSHDRDLLEGAVDRIWHLREGKLHAYGGGYERFERQLADEQRLQLRLKERQDAERARMQAFIDRFRAKNTKATQAQSRLKRLAKMEPVATIVQSPVPAIDLPSPKAPLGPPLVALDDVALGYDPARPVLTKLNLNIDPDDRIGLLGRNGAGKTTLARYLVGRLGALSGAARRHPKLEAAYFAQHQIEDLDPKASAYAHICALMPSASEAQRRARLGRFGLPGEKAETPAGDLSGGEKTRLLLHLVTFHGPHLLILDEPTNHLDMDSRSALADAINGYDGAVVLVSHDRRLLETCVDRLWLAAEGTVRPYHGDLDAYRAWVAAPEVRNGAAAAPIEDARALRRREAAARRSDVAPLKREAERWEKEVARLADVLAVIDRGLAAPGLYDRDPTAAAELFKKRAKAAELLEAAETNWLAAAEALEAAQR